MNKKTIILAYISIIGFLLIIILRIILTNKIWNFYNFNMKKIYGLITISIYFPILIISSLASLLVIYFYYKNKFKGSLKYLYLVIPSFIYILVCILALFGIPK